MKVIVAAVSFLLAGLATAQYQGVPQCAQPCVVLPDSCNGDITCICTYPGFIDTISCCVSKACDQASQQQALDTARNLCKGANVVLPSAAGCSGSTSASSTSSASGTAGAGSATTSATSSPSPSATGNPGNKLAVNGMGLAGVLLGAAAVL